MVGGTWTETSKQLPSSAKSWLTNKAWCTICELSQVLEIFKDFDIDFVSNLSSWRSLLSTDNPHERPFPGKIASLLNEF